MKKNYIIPNTESVVFYAGSICSASAGAGGTNVGGGTLTGGGQGENIDPL